MRQHNIPVKIIVFNNTVLGMVREYQHFTYDSRYSVIDLKGSPDLSKIAEAYGMKFLKVSRPSEAAKCLDAFLREDESFLMEVMIDPEDIVR